MKVQTSKIFDSRPEDIWPLLFNSKMDKDQPCLFLCGLPKPIECRLAGEGGVGGTRECVSDKGVIVQKILEWEPNSKLSFELAETNIYFGSCVKSIVETFEIEQINHNRSLLTRKTNFKVKPPYNVFLSVPMFIGLKAIHSYVFKNWKRLAKQN